jgi:predicted transcriptional regulator
MLPFLISAQDTQTALAEHLKGRRKRLGFSRDALAERSGVPAPTIKKFETTGLISLRQFLLLWQTLDDLSRLHSLLKEQPSMPASIDEVLDDPR